jgi:transcriptional regulator with PAS, ATPase and Fis domain
MARRERASQDEPQIIGRSDVMVALRRKIERVGPTEATVLIRGERGTGKELIASAIHRASPRPHQPYVVVNCAALPLELLASELFGHEPGAFTGAVGRRRGLIAAAAGGTVFLDEIGDLRPEGQAILLRFLQDREVRPLGSTTASHVDVRVLAATNAHLEQAIERGTFRADLYDRLAEVVLTVAPLRERGGDIPALVRHFVGRHTQRHHGYVRGLTADALALVERYAWPGNVRELERAVSRAVIFASGPWIGPADLDLPGGVLSTVNIGRLPPAGLSPRQEQIEALASACGAVRRRDVVSRLGISGETARRELSALVRLGILRRHGRHRGCRYVPVSGPPA